MNALLLKLEGGDLIAFVLVLARVTPLFVIAPLFSSQMIPPHVRGIIAVGISIGLAPIALHGQHIPTDPLVIGGLVIESMLVGGGFAMTLAVLLAAVESAAQASPANVAAAIRYRIFDDRKATDDVAILTLRFAERRKGRAAIFEQGSQTTVAAGTKTGHG